MRARALRQVVVFLAVLLAPLQVLPLDELLDALLDEQRRRVEARGEVARDFHQQGVVVQPAVCRPSSALRSLLKRSAPSQERVPFNRLKRQK